MFFLPWYLHSNTLQLPKDLATISTSCWCCIQPCYLHTSFQLQKDIFLLLTINVPIRYFKSYGSGGTHLQLPPTNNVCNSSDFPLSHDFPYKTYTNTRGVMKRQYCLQLALTEILKKLLLALYCTDLGGFTG